MTAIANPPAHRVARAVAGMHAVLDEVADASVWSMDLPATRTTLDDLQRLTNRVAGLQAQVLAHADQLKAGDESGATSTVNWLAHHTKLTRREAGRQVRLAAWLDKYDAKTLRILGRRLLEVIAPEIADAHEAKLLEREERDAATACRLTMTEDGHGKVHGRSTPSPGAKADPPTATDGSSAPHTTREPTTPRSP